MSITQRRYKLLADFQKVHDFLTETYDKETLNSYLLPQYVEYAHSLLYFDFKHTHRFGLWEDEGRLVGIACYEMGMGTIHLHAGKGYECLLPDMLSWGETELSESTESRRRLSVWIIDREEAKRKLLLSSGYVLERHEPVNVFDYAKPFTERKLPQGFRIIDGTQVDFKKLDACFWYGFENMGIPFDGLECNIRISCAPHANMELMTIITAPDGAYACALGMWLDETNKYAYLEPLATVPEYRRMGLATVCLTEAMKKTKQLGAAYCFGGAREFYSAIGFETICQRELWKKEW
jgi:hypothetical protein